MPDSTTARRELTVKPFPFLEDLEAAIVKPFREAEDALDALTMFLRNVVGEIPGAQWEARLEKPPTVENIGALLILVEQLEGHVSFFAERLEMLKQVRWLLDGMRLEGRVSEWVQEGDDA